MAPLVIPCNPLYARGRERVTARESERDPQSKGWRLTGTVGGWWVRADPNVQMAKAKAQSAATWSGTELICAAVQQGKTLNCVVMTMRL